MAHLVGVRLVLDQWLLTVIPGFILLHLDTRAFWEGTYGMPAPEGTSQMILLVFHFIIGETEDQ